MASPEPKAAGQSADPGLDIEPSDGFPDWLAATGSSLALASDNAGKLILVGTRGDGLLSIFERSFADCAALAAGDRSLWLASGNIVWRLENALAEGESADGFDAHYVPQAGFVTGAIGIGDMVLDQKAGPIFASTRFSCAGRPSASVSFEPVWQPGFISALAPEDRCHLSGLATVKGRIRFATLFAPSDDPDGWRGRERGGTAQGRLVDMTTGRTIVDGIDQPRSPRSNRGRLWLLEAGKGRLCRVELKERRLVPVADCAGYPTALAFLKDTAVVALSQPATGWEAPAPVDGMSGGFCGLAVFDAGTGQLLHWLRLGHPVTRTSGLAVLAGCRRPRAIGFRTDEISRTVVLPTRPSQDATSTT